MKARHRAGKKFDAIGCDVTCTSQAVQTLHEILFQAAKFDNKADE